MSTRISSLYSVVSKAAKLLPILALLGTSACYARTSPGYYYGRPRYGGDVYYYRAPPRHYYYAPERRERWHERGWHDHARERGWHEHHDYHEHGHHHW